MKGRLRGAGWTALAATMLALSPARAHAQPDDDPSNPRTGRPTPEAIQGANGATPAKGVEGDSTEAARQDEGVEDAGVSTRRGDPLALAPAALEARVTRPPFGSRVVRLSGAMWLGAPQCTGGDTTAARRACLADRERSLPRRLFALDLHSADGTAIEGSRISGSITVAGGAAAASGAPSRWTATFPLAGVRSGKYTGRILLPRDSGLAVSSVTIPVTLHVRDSPLWPLLVLLSGLLLVMALRKYRDGRLEQDNRYLEIADAEALIVTDPHLADPAGLAAPFRERLASLLRASVTRVEKGASGPIAELKEADALWLAWQAGRPSWVAGLEMDRSGIERLTRAATERAAAGYGRSRHLQRLLKLLAMAYNDAPPSPPPPGDEGPAARPGAEAAAYRAGAADRAVLVTRYFSLAARIAQFRAEAGAIADPAARAKLLAVLDEVSAEWNEADPEDEGSDALLGELHARAEAARTQSLPAATPPFAGPDSSVSSSEAGRMARSAADDTASELVPRRFAARISSARRARRIYAITAGLLVYLGLAAVGLRETWGDNSSFGADRLADYLEVLAWALGANAASVASIAAFAGQLSIPWLGRVLGGGAAPGAAADSPGAGAELAPLSPRAAPRLRRL